MGPAPLPPHERSWRHPSEVGPTRVELEAGGPGRPIFFATSAVAAVLLVGLIVVMTPRPGAGPDAISATTRPAMAETAAARPQASGGSQIITASRAPRLASFAPIPNAIAVTPVAHENTIVVAAAVPADGETVHVKTDQATYRIDWADLAFLELDESALVLNDRGELVARIADGDIIVLVD